MCPSFPYLVDSSSEEPAFQRKCLKLIEQSIKSASTEMYFICSKSVLINLQGPERPAGECWWWSLLLISGTDHNMYFTFRRCVSVSFLFPLLTTVPWSNIIPIYLVFCFYFCFFVLFFSVSCTNALVAYETCTGLLSWKWDRRAWSLDTLWTEGSYSSTTCDIYSE